MSPTTASFSNGSTTRSPRSEEAKKSDSSFWKILAFVMVGVTLLYASDRFQIGHLPSNNVHSGSFAEEVVYKHPVTTTTQQQQQQPASSGETINNNQTTTTTTPPPPPIQAPTTPPQAVTETNPGPTSPPETKTPPQTDSETTDSNKNNNGGINKFDKKFPPTITTFTNGQVDYYTYQPRGRPMDDTARKQLIDQWGSWTLGDDLKRPLLTEDFYKQFPNRDIPHEKFPSNAWQKDKAYLSKFLPESIALVQRAQDAILAEYGQPSDGTWEERSKMFRLQFHPEDLNVSLTDRKGKSEPGDEGGWTTQQSWDGLKRRLLHSIVTEDSFVFAMGGHSSAAGHGNLFQQSYTLQVQWILEAVFARLGVRHQARNFGNGGLGTLHNGIAAGSTYGPDVDMLMWDSGMTESDSKAKDIFHRQGLLGGVKVPVLWTKAADEAKFYHQKAGAHVGGPGTGRVGIITGQNDVTKIETEIPFAAQYMDCTNDISSICKDHEYDGVCWIDRPDVTPGTGQKAYPDGRAGWHPGNKVHRLQGRVIAFTILQALKEALTIWSDAQNYELNDNDWHITDHYNEVRKRLNEHLKEGECNKYDTNGLADMCKFPMKARTEFTPRAYPSFSSIRSLMPPEQLQYIDPAPQNIYDPPDVFIPSLHPPEGAIDVLSIVEAGPAFQPVLVPDYVTDFYKKPKFEKPPQVPVGKGITLETAPGDEYCDGTVDSWCERGKDQNCLLRSHNDGRHGLKFDGYSGWIVLNLPDVKNGLILVKIQTWHQPGEARKTDGWNSINNEGSKAQRRLKHSSFVENSTRLESLFLPESDNSIQALRNLRRKNQDVPFCPEFQMEYAIDGKINFWNLTEFNTMKVQGSIQRVIEIYPLLNDRRYTGGQEKEVEVAIRITGCGRQKTFNINHIYWS